MRIHEPLINAIKYQDDMELKEYLQAELEDYEYSIDESYSYRLSYDHEFELYRDTLNPQIILKGEGSYKEFIDNLTQDILFEAIMKLKEFSTYLHDTVISVEYNKVKENCLITITSNLSISDELREIEYVQTTIDRIGDEIVNKMSRLLISDFSINQDDDLLEIHIISQVSYFLIKNCNVKKEQLEIYFAKVLLDKKLNELNNYTWSNYIRKPHTFSYHISKIREMVQDIEYLLSNR